MATDRFIKSNRPGFSPRPVLCTCVAFAAVRTADEHAAVNANQLERAETEQRETVGLFALHIHRYELAV